MRQVTIGNLPQDAYMTYTGIVAGAPYTAQVRTAALPDAAGSACADRAALRQAAAAHFQRRLRQRRRVSRLRVACRIRELHPSDAHRWGARDRQSELRDADRGAGLVCHPKVGVRYVDYNLTSNTPPAQETSPTSTIPWFSADSGLLFERPINLFGQARTQTLEPRLFYVYVPYRNQDAIPLFDTALADLNFAQLFSENRFVGGDRFGDANQVTMALTSRFLQANGQEGLRATIAQRHYFQDERVGLTPTSTPRTTNDSDLLASIGGRLSRAWAFDVTTQWGQQQQRTERSPWRRASRPRWRR